MLRDRFKKAAKRVGRRLFDMRDQAAPRDVRERDVDPDATIPRLQEGSGDTPGPNHKENIGRTWVSAQVLSGMGIVCIDVRSPSEWKAGHIPSALFIPASAVAGHLDRIPGQGTDTAVAVYDATGEQRSAEIAAFLRDSGWERARRLVGGFAEWVEEGEEVEIDDDAAGDIQIGDSVRVDGAAAQVWEVAGTLEEPTFGVVVLDSGDARTGLSREEIVR